MKPFIFSLLLICGSFFTSFAIGPITGTTNVCPGFTTTLADATAGGTWSSSDYTIASVGSVTGVVTGVIAGTVTITYSLGASYAISSFTVNPTPDPISGITAICYGHTTTLSDIDPGGTWSSSTLSIATVGSVSGIVTGVTTGPATITLTLPTGCYTTMPVTVYPLPAAITGTTTLCTGATATLSDATGGGTWSSSNTAVANVISTLGLVSGVSGGTAMITYELGTGCLTTTTVTVTSGPGPITGVLSLCAGATATLSDGVSGGSWGSSNVMVATVGSATGLLTGVLAGTAHITYSLGGGCRVTATATVLATPAAITGPTGICAGISTTLSDAITGGAWTSSNTAVASVGSSSGIVFGLALGTSIITYELSTGCFVTEVFSIESTAGVITGPSRVCIGDTATLSDPPGVGAWSSGNVAVGTINSNGLFTGVSTGTTAITYSLGAGCTVFRIESVGAGIISGSTNICVGSAVTFTDGFPAGAWSSSNTAVGSISGGGVLTGISAGTTSITYLLGGCVASIVVSVYTPPTIIGGPSSVCVGDTATLIDPPGGAWTSGNVAVGTINSNGLFTGVATGTTAITYSLGTGCTVSRIESVGAGIISGSANICVGSAVTFTDGFPGGAWSSSNTAVGTISGGGVLTGLSAGTTIITYLLGSCTSAIAATISTMPAAISGTSALCAGSATTLTDATGGGTWTSSNIAVANVIPTLGLVSGVSAGTVMISYILGSGCATGISVTVTPVPTRIAGFTTVCLGDTTTLSDGVSGGVWTSSNTSVATIAVSGLVTGISSGTTLISYSIGTCSVQDTVAVITAPAAIVGSPDLIWGSIETLTDTTSGGVWSSSSTIITIGSSTGIVTAGVISGTSLITYSLGTSCFTTFTVSIFGEGAVRNVNSTNNAIILYPNPAVNELTIETDPGAYQSFSIVNETGETVMQHPITALQTTANIKSLPQGLYFITFKGANAVAVRKFLKE